MKDLKVDYLDLYLIHYPIALKYQKPPLIAPAWVHDPKADVPRMEFENDVTYQQTWEAMEQLVREGLVRNIGVSNVASGKISDILKYAKIKPAIVQNEIHPHLCQDKLLKHARLNGVQVMAYSSFGDLSQGGK